MKTNQKTVMTTQMMRRTTVKRKMKRAITKSTKSTNQRKVRLTRTRRKKMQVTAVKRTRRSTRVTRTPTPVRLTVMRRTTTTPKPLRTSQRTKLKVKTMRSPSTQKVNYNITLGYKFDPAYIPVVRFSTQKGIKMTNLFNLSH